ncbi:RodZ domain-containing protein [Marinimicrobium agarilyticum]|uniref:RodZ domain-containing protein n=1 Tax=Marinimicrobium agarilyticum TaxID=306546 RepID=UPI0003FBA687|nr:RodZ family helix-turn-helix domain-containing protein [Marinimicrobium agarilyticum]
MSADEPLENNEPASAPGERPGALLKSAREQAKLSEEDVARELRMTVTKVRALEADEYEKLHSDTFIRGYLRTYSKLLNLDPNTILDAYKQTRREAGLGDEPEESPLQINVPAPARSMGKFIIWIIVLLAGIWALSVWFLGNRQDTVEPAPVMDPVSDVAPNGPANDGEPTQTGAFQDTPADPVATQSESPGNAPVGSSAEGPDAALAQPTPGAGDTQAPQTQASVAAAESGNSLEEAASLNEPEAGTENDNLDQMRLSFTEECWLEVTDSRGDVLETDLMQPGQTLELQGEAPFTVKLGNAAGANIQLNGEPFEFDRPPSGRYMAVTVN